MAIVGGGSAGDGDGGSGDGGLCYGDGNLELFLAFFFFFSSSVVQFRYLMALPPQDIVSI